MSSLELGPAAEPRPTAGDLIRLLDVAFGFFVWSAHFLVVYIAAAVACVLGLGGADPGARSTFLTALAAVTAAASAVLLLHASLRYLRDRGQPEARFRMAVTIGGDAVAVMAVLWQLFPIFLVPVCA